MTLCGVYSEWITTPVVITSDCGCFLLRDEGEQPEDLTRRGKTVTERPAACREVFV